MWRNQSFIGFLLFFVEGEGVTPPENVGVVPGYEYYLEALTNPNHPEHHAMESWENEQGVKKFERESINRWLKRRLGWVLKRSFSLSGKCSPWRTIFVTLFRVRDLF
jgi:hypothetical protein